MMLGMNVPRSGFEPLDPDGPTGKRLVSLIGRDVFDKFDRTNVLDRRIWSRQAARARASEVIASLRGRTVMVFGNEAWLTLSLPSCVLLECVVMNESDEWYRVPHPSGRNRWYNEIARRGRVRDLFESISREAS